jgi:hypothetical protein
VLVKVGRLPGICLRQVGDHCVRQQSRAIVLCLNVALFTWSWSREQGQKTEIPALEVVLARNCAGYTFFAEILASLPPCSNMIWNMCGDGSPTYLVKSASFSMLPCGHTIA